jgi:hypothetical protein
MHSTIPPLNQGNQQNEKDKKVEDWNPTQRSKEKEELVDGCGVIL